MKKAEKIRKITTRISAAVIFACLLVMTMQINIQGDSSNSPLSLSSLTFGLIQPAVAQLPVINGCEGGGTTSGCELWCNTGCYPESGTGGNTCEGTDGCTYDDVNEAESLPSHCGPC